MPITALYASLLVPLFLLLASRVIRTRRGASVAVGDGGSRARARDWLTTVEATLRGGDSGAKGAYP